MKRTRERDQTFVLLETVGHFSVFVLKSPASWHATVLSTNINFKEKQKQDTYTNLKRVDFKLDEHLHDGKMAFPSQKIKCHQFILLKAKHTSKMKQKNSPCS